MKTEKEARKGCGKKFKEEGEDYICGDHAPQDDANPWEILCLPCQEKLDKIRDNRSGKETAEEEEEPLTDKDDKKFMNVIMGLIIGMAIVFAFFVLPSLFHEEFPLKDYTCEQIESSITNEDCLLSEKNLYRNKCHLISELRTHHFNNCTDLGVGG